MSQIALVCILWSQEAPAQPQPQDQFFSGTVTEISAERIKVHRTVLGKNSEDRAFAITQETRMEGKPRTGSRVTVRFVTGDEGDRAVHIVVRSSNQKR